jgi:putative spermidine/putrescine transport system ATP-binding protein
MSESNSQSTIHNSQFLVLDRLDKHFAGLHVITDLSLSVEKSETVALLGPSGSGKTTVLRLVAGFETPDAGRILVEGEDVTRTPPERRRFGMVFQHYALFPHMTVGENVAFGLESRGLRGSEVARRVAETLAVVELSGFEQRRVTQLSGGQQQRVALARALAPQPRVLLLDEPLSNLDPTLRERTRRELKRLIGATGITTLFVTHEQEEAFELGDRVAVINRGRLEQVATAEELYERPATRFVATFIGRSNVLPAVWESSQPEGVRLATGQRWPATAADSPAPGAPVDLLVRPEGLAFGDPAPGRGLAGEIVARRYMGRLSLFSVRLEKLPEVEVLAGSYDTRVGERVAVIPSPQGPLPRAYPREEK